MKFQPNTYLLASMFVVIVSLASKTHAQQNWERGYSPACSERGGCSHGHDTLELIPYRSNSGYQDNRQTLGSNGYDYDNRLRSLYQAGVAPYPGCNGGCCGSCTNEVNPASQRRFDDRGNGYDNRQSPSNMYPYGSEYGGGQEYSAPARQRFESYQSTPADQPPSLSPSSYAPLSNNAANNNGPFSNSFGSDFQRSTQRMQPPFQPSQTATNSRGIQSGQPTYQATPQMLSQMLSRTKPPIFQPATNAPAEHDHTGHDHAGHSH